MVYDAISLMSNINMNGLHCYNSKYTCIRKRSLFAGMSDDWLAGWGVGGGDFCLVGQLSGAMSCSDPRNGYATAIWLLDGASLRRCCF